MKQWYSAFELAGLPDLPALPNNITRKAKAEQWQWRQRTGRGGGREYAHNSLPQPTQAALIQDSVRHKIVDLDLNPPKPSSTVCFQLPQQVRSTSEQRIDAWLEILRAYERWCDLWRLDYEQRPHGRAGIGLEGKSPLEVLAAAVNGGWISHQIQNPRELDFLMMTAPGKEGTRKVGRQGISVCGRLYVAAELAGWIGKTVYVCFDPQQPSTIYVYGNDYLRQATPTTN
jgi:hypothetical protein